MRRSTRGPKAVVLFETSGGDTRAQGLIVVERDDAGLIRGLTVLFRPLECSTSSRRP